ncbi:hypothetical protein DC20_01815 [Rufibacter tibetensis]|uniref:Uncharacterized protein n=1 Tax=Rufibacter tibetensis TaxID=512763 RepID=A0A0N7HW09_9BACT|nr:hypothetical protein DC20_01815 [Rufibacter tibetensis]
MIKKYIFWLGCFLLVVLLTLQAEPTQAQCAMCTASVESSSQSGDSIANGLNKGILYLMAVPYIIACCVGFFWYKYSRKK